MRICQNILFIIFVFLLINEIDGRRGRGRIKGFRVRLGNSLKNPVYRRISLPRKSTASGTGFLVGTLAFRSYVVNHRGIRPALQNGSGEICSNYQNISNYIFSDFRCPLTPIFSPSDRYCCGRIREQFCCSFWERRMRSAVCLYIDASSSEKKTARSCSLVIHRIFSLEERCNNERDVQFTISLLEKKNEQNMLGGRAVGAIIGIISGSSLLLLLFIFCIVYYRRYLRRKKTPVVRSYLRRSNDDLSRRHCVMNSNQQPNVDQVACRKPLAKTSIPRDSPPSYTEAIKHLRPTSI